ncbi:MAG: flagellar biosynthetic protein FliO [Kyrpidia sp.]|nr:flagellar biosynthetic protein FliO [Kyrpidia sp.]
MKPAVLAAAQVWMWGWPRFALAVTNSVEDAVRRTPSSGSPPAMPPEPSLGLSLAKLGIGLLVVLAVIWLVSRWVRRRWPRAAGGEALRVLGTLPLGPGKSVCLVEVADRVLVLGVGQEIRVLEVIDDPERRDKLRPDGGAIPVAFDRQLAEALRRMADRRRTWLRRQRGSDADE